MSKVGERPISVPVTVAITMEKNVIGVKGSTGELKIAYPVVLDIVKKDNELHVRRQGNSKKNKSVHGLFRSLIANAVIGVEKPWEKTLEVVGTGFNAKLQGEDVVLKVGYSHEIIVKAQPGIKFSVLGNNKIVVSGADKQLVGQVAYQIKLKKKPDAYKGKGIRYLGEKLRIKPGKKAKAATAA